MTIPGFAADIRQNLLTIALPDNLPSMFTSKLLPFVNSLQNRKWSDDEVVEDLDFLKHELQSRLEGLRYVSAGLGGGLTELSTYDEYISEIDSGHLVWSPAHDSEDFWKENGMRIGQESSGKAVKYVHSLSLFTRADGRIDGWWNC